MRAQMVLTRHASNVANMRVHTRSTHAYMLCMCEVEVGTETLLPHAHVYAHVCTVRSFLILADRARVVVAETSVSANGIDWFQHGIRSWKVCVCC
jgi:hypothetical protein